MVARGCLSVGLKERSTTAPVITFLSLVRTKAAPLPGLTCWKSTMVQTPPSHSMVTPLRKSPAVIMWNPSKYAYQINSDACQTPPHLGDGIISNMHSCFDFITSFSKDQVFSRKTRPFAIFFINCSVIFRFQKRRADVQAPSFRSAKYTNGIRPVSAPPPAAHRFCHPSAHNASE